ncbi:MAG: hypothetical protein KDD11_11880 [Acidobacteria bacterium]|nr:hypothetical protein [Acidobacteriota bacterium]
MRARSTFPILAFASLLLIAGCSSDRVEDTDGSVILSISDFDGLATRVSVNSSGSLLTLGSITISNIAKNPSRPTSAQQNVEMDTYEVSFSRADAGTRLPPVLVRKVLGVAPVQGTQTYNNLPLMGIDQFENPPLEDLFFINGAFDTETGAQVITLNLTLRFFGRTIAGDDVATQPVTFTIEFVP